MSWRLFSTGDCANLFVVVSFINVWFYCRACYFDGWKEGFVPLSIHPLSATAEPGLPSWSAVWTNGRFESCVTWSNTDAPGPTPGNAASFAGSRLWHGMASSDHFGAAARWGRIVQHSASWFSSAATPCSTVKGRTVPAMPPARYLTVITQWPPTQCKTLWSKRCFPLYRWGH